MERISDAGCPHDSWAAHYETVMSLSFGRVYARLTSCTLEEVRRLVPPGGALVDFGAGCGRMAIPLAMEGYRVTAVEPSSRMLDTLRSRLAATPLDVAERVRPVHAAMQTYRPDRTYDLALCVFTVIAYLLDERALREALASVASSVEPGGLFLVDVPDADVFTSFDEENEHMIRTVEIQPLEGALYQYSEHTTLRAPDGPVTYRDRFPLRRWSVEEITDALTKAGFEPHENVASRFENLGAHYLLWRRS